PTPPSCPTASATRAARLRRAASGFGTVLGSDLVWRRSLPVHIGGAVVAVAVQGLRSHLAPSQTGRTSCGGLCLLLPFCRQPASRCRPTRRNFLPNCPASRRSARWGPVRRGQSCRPPRAPFRSI